MAATLCTCGGCGETFHGLRAFDAHQRATDEPPRFTVCLDPRSACMASDEAGRWYDPAARAKARERVRSLRDGDGS